MAATPLIFKRIAVDNHTPPVLLLFGEVPPTGTLIKAYTTVGWVTGTLKRWNGSTWIDTNLKRRTLDDWV